LRPVPVLTAFVLKTLQIEIFKRATQTSAITNRSSLEALSHVHSQLSKFKSDHGVAGEHHGLIDVGRKVGHAPGIKTRRQKE
jgi:hypothetical protein